MTMAGRRGVRQRGIPASDAHVRRGSSSAPSRWSGLIVCLLAVATLLVGCGGEAVLVPPSPAAPRPTSAPVTSQASPVTIAATPVATPSVGAVVWATDVDAKTSAPVAPVTRYTPDAPRLIAVTRAARLPPGSRIDATWDYNNTSLDALTTRVVTADQASDRWISFSIDRDPAVLWPVGSYDVAISLDGQVVQRSSVEVAAKQ
jgi:hypothetical protein